MFRTWKEKLVTILTTDTFGGATPITMECLTALAAQSVFHRK